jgi:hypothetical protein
MAIYGGMIASTAERVDRRPRPLPHGMKRDGAPRGRNAHGAGKVATTVDAHQAVSNAPRPALSTILRIEAPKSPAGGLR